MTHIGNQTDARPADRRLTTILVLGMISAIGSMAIHMLAPSLPLLQRELETNVAEAQLVIGSYLAGLGVGQLLAGPLVDRLGRIPVLLAGLGCFIAGSVAAFLAPQLEWLLAARVLQAIGGAAGVISARVLVIDIFGNEGGAGQQAKLMMIVLVSPALSPFIGGYIANAGGWRMVLAVLAAVGMIVALLAWRVIAPQARAVPRSSRKTGSLTADLARLARNRPYLLSVCVMACSSSALYVFLASGAFVLEHQFGLGERAAGVCFLLVALAAVAGTRLVGTFERHGNPLLAGSGIIVFGTILLLVLSVAGISGPVALTGSMMFLGVGAGITGPAAIHHAVSAEPGLAGTSTSIAGATQMLVSAAATVPMGWLAPITQFKLAAALTLAASLAFVAATLRARSERDALSQQHWEPSP